MKTTILITEQQKRILMLESVNNEIEDNVNGNQRLFKRISKYSIEEFSNNLGFLMTWGAGIGGFMSPVNDFLEGRYPELPERNITLILLAVVGTLFMNKRNFIKEVIQKVKEKGLFEEFKQALNKSKELKNTFISFLENMGVTIKSLITMLSYAFLIPSLMPIVNFIESGMTTQDDISTFITSISASGAVTLSGKILGEFFKKLINHLNDEFLYVFQTNF